MADNLRKLNVDGISHFKAYLADLRKDRTLAPDLSVLDDGATSEFVAGGVELERVGFTTKKQAASGSIERKVPRATCSGPIANTNPSSTAGAASNSPIHGS